MNKDDKQFLVGLIGQQNQKFTGLFKGLEQKITGIQESLEKKIDKNSEEIRYNGVLIERQQDFLYGMSERIDVLHDRSKRVETDVADIKKTIHDYPIVRKMVQKHDKQLAKLS